MARKRKRRGNGRQLQKTARLNLMITPALKRKMHTYAKRNGTSISSLITAHFLSLLEKEKELDVEQI